MDEDIKKWGYEFFRGIPKGRYIQIISAVNVNNPEQIEPPLSEDEQKYFKYKRSELERMRKESGIENQIFVVPKDY